MTITLVVLVLGSLYWLLFTIRDYSIIYYPIASVMVFWGLANKNLIDEAKKVEYAITDNSLEAGRKQLSYIVGRDTTNLTPAQIRTAVLETLSENLSDGIIAPLFYYALGGVPLMFSYKMINTLDSMIGYKNEKHREFGRFAARLDDVANYIPARITALIMLIVSGKPCLFKFVIHNAPRHASPNSGWPEAALAGILNCRVGGPSVYHGQVLNKSFIGTHARQITSLDIKRTCNLNHVSTMLFIVLLIFIRLLIAK